MENVITEGFNFLDYPEGDMESKFEVCGLNSTTMPRFSPAVLRATTRSKVVSTSTARLLPAPRIPTTRSGLLSTFGKPAGLSPILPLATPSLLSTFRTRINILLNSVVSSPTPTLQTVRHRTGGTTYQPSQRKRKRTHGFLAKKKTKGGQDTLRRRRLKGRRFLSH